MAKTRLGFDIGSNSMKVAVRKGGDLRVEEVRLPENMVDEAGNITLPHAFTQFLKQQKKELALPRGKASLVLPPSQVICRLVTMPKMTTDQLIMNLPYEFADFVQGAADQYFCDYALCTPTEEESESGSEEENGEPGVPMMAAAAAKQTLAEYVSMFARAGIKLKTILPQEMALINLVKNRKPDGAEEFCFVDLGQQATRITVVWRDRVQATRQIGLGGRNMDLAAADRFGVDPFLANTYKYGNYQGIQSSAVVTDVCDRIAVEILKVINFYQFTYRNSNLEGIYLVGGGSAMPYLRKSIEDTVGLSLLSPGDLLPGTRERAADGIFAAGAAMGGK